MKIRYRVMVLLALLVLPGCRGGGKVAVPQQKLDKNNAPPKAEITAKGSKIRLPLNAGKQVWEAEAESIAGDFIAGTGVMYRLKCRWLENNKSIISAQAGKAGYTKEKQEITLSDGVKAEWPNRKAKVVADRMIWQLERRQLVAEGKVHFSQGEEQFTAHRLQADFGLKSVALTD